MARAMTRFSSRHTPLAIRVRIAVARRGLEMRQAAKEIGCSRPALYQALSGARMGPTVKKIERWLRTKAKERA